MLLVSIHDVSPARAVQVARLWELCRSRGVIPALAVVPNWHGDWPLEEYPGFVDWVRTRVAEGAVIALHGERHDEVGLRRSLADHLKAWGRTDSEGEFLTLDHSAAAGRLAQGRERLRKVGLEPAGFVPPAWLAPELAHRSAAAAGFIFSEDDHSIRLLRESARLPSPVVRWSTRSRARAWGSVAVARGRSLLQRGARYPRIALHPGDLDHPATERSVRETLDLWLQRHSPGSYIDLAASFVG
jgi:uncharacterized protein